MKLVFLLVLLNAGVGLGQGPQHQQGIEMAACEMRSFMPEHSGIAGLVVLENSQPLSPISRVDVRVVITGLPRGNVTLHGFHIHEHGNLTNGCLSTGGHYNPTNTVHGAPGDSPDARHVGDFGNVRKEADGTIRTNFQANSDVKLHGSTSVVGRAIVLHAGEDDLGQGGDAGSLASGNAGPRLACCIIEGSASARRRIRNEGTAP